MTIRYKNTKDLYDLSRLESQAEDLLENSKDAVHLCKWILQEYSKDSCQRASDMKQSIESLLVQLEDTIQKAIPSSCYDFIEVTWRKRRQTAKRDNMIHVAESKDATYTLCRKPLDHPDIPKSGLIKGSPFLTASLERCAVCCARSDGWLLETKEEDGDE